MMKMPDLMRDMIHPELDYYVGCFLRVKYKIENRANSSPIVKTYMRCRCALVPNRSMAPVVSMWFTLDGLAHYETLKHEALNL